MKSSLINIAIDGHSSCGKSSIAKDISKKFKMKYVDSRKPKKYLRNKIKF